MDGSSQGVKMGNDVKSDTEDVRNEQAAQDDMGKQASASGQVEHAKLSRVRPEVGTATTRLKAKKDKEQAKAMMLPKIAVGDTAVCRPWTPGEVREMVINAPKPITDPDGYYAWLCQTALTYDVLIPDMELLLFYTYDTDWAMCKRKFVMPKVRLGGQWPVNAPLEDWLEDVAKVAIEECAHMTGNASAAALCVQAPEELLPVFIQRFTKSWQESVGSNVVKGGKLAVNMFMANVDPQIANLYRVANRNWKRLDWEDMVTAMMEMYRDGCFARGKTAKVKQMMQKADQPACPSCSYQSPPHTQTKTHTHQKAQRKGNCRKCGKFGHWARECRSGGLLYQNNGGQYANQNQLGYQTGQQQLALPAAHAFPALPPPAGLPVGAVQYQPR